jgi:hypothetical protein
MDTLIDAAPVNPGTARGVSTFASAPQHLTLPSLINAHVWKPEAAMAMALLTPLENTGVGESVVVPSVWGASRRGAARRYTFNLAETAIHPMQRRSGSRRPILSPTRFRVVRQTTVVAAAPNKRRARRYYSIYFGIITY